MLKVISGPRKMEKRKPEEEERGSRDAYRGKSTRKIRRH